MILRYDQGMTTHHEPIDRTHPAIEEVARHLAELEPGEPWPSNEELGGHRLLGTRDDEYRFAMREQALELMSLVAPHITSAAPENLALLRTTPVGRALMAEGWDALIESMSASGEFHDVDLRTMERLNPYREGNA